MYTPEGGAVRKVEDRVRELEGQLAELKEIVYSGCPYTDASEHIGCLTLFDCQGECRLSRLTKMKGLEAKVQYLVDSAYTLAEEYGTPTPWRKPCITFPDGTVWYATGHKPT